MLDPTITVAAVTGTFGLLGVLSTRRVGTGKERRAERRTLEARSRLYEEAADTARSALREAGLPVPPWPSGLTDMREGADDK
jgi:hypothetical protein